MTHFGSGRNWMIEGITLRCGRHAKQVVSVLLREAEGHVPGCFDGKWNLGAPCIAHRSNFKSVVHARLDTCTQKLQNTKRVHEGGSIQELDLARLNKAKSPAT
ncbi:BZ3500_MvSof-1268-A1-R1_Chr10-2g02904 [Microbotryum saponariae]|uniref:BZ3500_MvSof-1268-A1-R1_Chr10-2g02904 protein n=1 Tax=Microbotryum saponariae TaxID=289078 RepID=A0A2X0K853_9BASI|nr:BZ3501_MvSof-1269-A2-R1_Chr10-2g02490 [Microbotryum saponariae]SDA01711.1 BZ3500_MvSof-1268-A1-R1_Chr10-2g02904 [Microbotryum saponariae]